MQYESKVRGQRQSCYIEAMLCVLVQSRRWRRGLKQKGLTAQNRWIGEEMFLITTHLLSRGNDLPTQPHIESEPIRWPPQERRKTSRGHKKTRPPPYRYIVLPARHLDLTRGASFTLNGNHVYCVTGQREDVFFRRWKILEVWWLGHMGGPWDAVMDVWGYFLPQEKY